MSTLHKGASTEILYVNKSKSDAMYRLSEHETVNSNKTDKSRVDSLINASQDVLQCKGLRSDMRHWHLLVV